MTRVYSIASQEINSFAVYRNVLKTCFILLSLSRKKLGFTNIDWMHHHQNRLSNYSIDPLPCHFCCGLNVWVPPNLYAES